MVLSHKWKFVSGDSSKCVGCCVCEYVCSMEHEKTYNPTKSRIRVVRLSPFVNLAIACRLCEDPQCVIACPREAALGALKLVILGLSNCILKVG